MPRFGRTRRATAWRVDRVAAATTMDVLTIAFTLVVLMVALRVFNKKTMGRCRCTARLDGKVVIVTGANTGKERTAIRLASHRCRLQTREENGNGLGLPQLQR